MDDTLEAIVAELRAACGVDLRGYRRSTLSRRVAARAAKTTGGDMDAYLRRLRTDSGECRQLVAAVTIKVSSFFRDPLVFEILAQRVIPKIINRKRDGGVRNIRVWSAGCARGEEPYSLAILIHSALKGERTDWRPMVFATDLDGGALASAEAGVYSSNCLEDVKLGVLDRCFLPAGNGRYAVRPFVKKIVRFSREDLASPARIAPAESIFGDFDLVLCRNVLIYFSATLRRQVMQRLCASIAPGGYLVLGISEFLEAGSKSLLAVVDAENRVFRRPLR